MIGEGIVAKLTGSVIGSSFALVIRNNGKVEPLQLLKRFVVGVTIGVVFSPILIDYFGGKHEFDYWIASSVAAGLIGYLTLHVILNFDYHSVMKRKLRR